MEPDVHDVTALALHHARQQKPRAVHDAFDVGVDHPIPIVQVRALCGVEPQRAARIVHKNIDSRQLLRQPADCLLHFVPFADIERERVELRAQLFGKTVQSRSLRRPVPITVAPSCRKRRAMAVPKPGGWLQ